MRGKLMMDADRRMISPSFVEEALDCLRRAGKPTAPLLASLGLPPVVEKPISAENYGALWLAVAAEVDDEFFGMGERPMRRGSFTLLCHCVLHAKRWIRPFAGRCGFSVWYWRIQAASWSFATVSLKSC
jgi:hypothetical protein